MSTILTIPKDYGYVLLAVAGIGIQCFLSGFSIGMARRKAFPEDFMKENFGEIHRTEIGEEVRYMGFPDTGSGRYSEKLDYTRWFNFCCAQRAHGNFVEQIGIVVPLLLISGVFFPLITACIGFCYFLTRLYYLYTYRNDGTDSLESISYIFMLLIINLAILTILGGIEMIQ